MKKKSKNEIEWGSSNDELEIKQIRIKRNNSFLISCTP